MKFRNVAIVVGLFVAMLFSQSLKAAQNSPFANSNNLALHFKLESTEFSTVKNHSLCLLN